MSLLSPRFFVLPLVAVAIILSLPRGPLQAGKENVDLRAAAEQQAIDCATPAGAQICNIAVAGVSSTIVR
jgi:hypothetical protein